LNQLKQEIVHLTHNDCDAVGCMINLHYAFPNSFIQTFHTNYKDLNEKIHDVLEYIHKHNIKLLVISDVSFAQNKSELLHIQEEVQNKLNIKILYFDHHTYSDDFFNDITFYYKHDVTKSATLIINETLNNSINVNLELNKLSKIINDFDIWVENSKTFKLSLGVNDWFWSELKYKSIDDVAYNIINNNYKMPKSFLNYFKEYTNKYELKLKNLKEKQLFVNDGFLALVFTDEYFNEALYESFHTNNNKMALIINSYGIIRIRFSTIDCLENSEKEKIKFSIMNTLEHGHLNAFSIKVENSNFEKIMKKVQELNQIINENKPDIYK